MTNWFVCKHRIPNRMRNTEGKR